MSQRHCHPTKRFSRVLVFAYFGCTSKSDISVPHLPYCYADMVCIPTVHARGMTSIMQSIPPRFPFSLFYRDSVLLLPSFPKDLKKE